MNDDLDPHPAQHSWRQVFIHFHDYAVAEHISSVHIGLELASAETARQISSWFFTRKNPCWRLRFRPARDSAEQNGAFVHQRLDRLQAAGHIANWVETLYEPETYAFGGAEGMTLAHRLFHADSRHILAYLANQGANTSGGRGDQRRELSVLLCSILMRSARQDWYEQADIWARVAEFRPHPPGTPSGSLSRLESGVRRLMTVDTSPASPLLQERGSRAFLSEWAAAFADAGQTLGELARNGTLRRGLRAVLAHHIIFHWNRLGLPSTTQSLLAYTAKAVVLGSDESGAVPGTTEVC
ncbi:MAG TPA: thiopeptide-type bacteriocin biosynthesis protein [Pseudonocardiaceae bacterium]|jgi:thiopeptide-type bacteriocin biosynthesis protein|nr:thiopeptide-type bacteriocin biosynthesis protein [Pseudonocardiaceae bacterium]